MDKTMFICTHKDFVPMVNSGNYVILSSKPLKEEYSGLPQIIIGSTKLPLDDRYFSEFYHIKYVYEQNFGVDRIGICHYRRYFNFHGDIPDFAEDEIIVPTPMKFDVSVRQQYGYFHNAKDLNLLESIVNTLYPLYSKDLRKFLRDKTFYPYNMFVMSKDWFDKYCEFVFTCLIEWLTIVDTLDIEGMIEDEKKDYLKDFYPNNTIDYQKRVLSFLGERLTSLFIMHNFPKEKRIEYPVIITENKYMI